MPARSGMQSKNKRRGPAPASSLSKHTVGNALVVSSAERITNEAQSLAMSVAADGDNDLVVIDFASDLPISAWDGVADLLPKRRRGVRLVLGGRSREATAMAGQWLSERLGRTVIAPDGAIYPGVGGTLFVHSGKGSGWVRFRPGRSPEWEGKRFPKPSWDTGIVDSVATSALGMAEPIPGGAWIHTAARDPRSRSHWARLASGMPCQPDVLTAVLGCPGAAPVSLDDVARFWRGLNAELRPKVRFVQYGPVRVPEGETLGQALADLLDERVACYTGMPVGSPASPNIYTMRPDGELGWFSFVRELGYLPRTHPDFQQAPVVLSHRAPVAAVERTSPTGYWYAPDAVLEVVQSGLWLRPPQDPQNAAAVRAKPWDPNGSLLVFDATDAQRAQRMQLLAQDVLARLDPATRVRSRLVAASELGRGSARVAGAAGGELTTRPEQPGAPAAGRTDSARVEVAGPREYGGPNGAGNAGNPLGAPVPATPAPAPPVPGAQAPVSAGPPAAAAPPGVEAPPSMDAPTVRKIAPVGRSAETAPPAAAPGSNAVPGPPPAVPGPPAAVPSPPAAASSPAAQGAPATPAAPAGAGAPAGPDAPAEPEPPRDSAPTAGAAPAVPAPESGAAGAANVPAAATPPRTGSAPEPASAMPIQLESSPLPTVDSQGAPAPSNGGPQQAPAGGGAGAPDSAATPAASADPAESAESADSADSAENSAESAEKPAAADSDDSAAKQPQPTRPQIQPTPQPEASAVLPKAGLAEERAWLRRTLSREFDAMSHSISRILSEHPGFQGQDRSDSDLLTDIVAARLYLPSRGEAVDRALRTAQDGPHVPLARCAVAGLNKLPSHRGATVFRASPDQQQWELYRQRRLVTEWGFTHTLTEHSPDQTGEVDVLVWSMTGRRTRLLETNDEDQVDNRVVFTPGTNFKVLELVEPTEDERGRVLLRELSESEVDESGKVHEREALDDLATTSLQRCIERWADTAPSGVVGESARRRFGALPGLV